jgi:hypothetical protein
MNFFFEIIGRMLENIYLFSKFWRKLGILILDLYFYGIKIQTNTKQDSVKQFVENYRFFEIIFEEIFFFFRTGRTRLMIQPGLVTVPVHSNQPK